MTTHVKVGGAWKDITDVQTKQSAAWKTVNNVYVRVGGVWEQVFVSSFVYTETISVDTADYDLNAKAITGGWNGTDDLQATITINPGIKVYGTSTGTPAFTVPSSFPGTSVINITNDGVIVGKAGTGGTGGRYSPNVANLVGNAGGPGLNVDVGPGIVTFTNNGTIAAGGGGGGGGGADVIPANPPTPGNPPPPVPGPPKTGPVPAPPKTPPNPPIPGNPAVFYEGGGGGGGAGSSNSPAAGGTSYPGPGNPGTAGTDSPGAGGAAPGPAGAGGAGGARGSNGASGVGSPLPAQNPKGGGATGTAINGFPVIVFPVAGTVSGPTAP
jgi:hypothetical protein